MKALSQALTSAQIQLNRKPVIKIQIQDYDYPAKSSKLCYSTYDWTLVHQNAAAQGVIACCAADGSLLMTHAGIVETANPVVRIENPTPDTDYSAWATSLGVASGGEVPSTYYYFPAYDMIASATTGEVIILSLQKVNELGQPYFDHEELVPVYGNVPMGWTLRYKSSMDNGVTWGSWQYMTSFNELNAYENPFGWGDAK